MDFTTFGASYRRLYGPIDDVVFTLDGNRAVRATDLCDDLTIAGAMEFTDKANKAVEYTYDANGNLTADQNRGITAIAYNELDLPERITFDDGKRIYYTYAADGRKLRVRYAQLNSHVGPITPIEDPFPMGGGTAGLNGGGMGDPGGGLEPVLDETVLLTRDYCGGHVWRNDTLERVMTDYGYFDGAGAYHAYVKDHQGNVRAVVAGGEAVERDYYYPYGMPIAGACAPSAEGIQPLKYTSKELDRFNRLDLYDFGARPYDPTRCAFLTGDPLAEKKLNLSPTTFCAANPIRYTDPKGTDEWYFNESGQIVNVIPNKRHDSFYVIDKNGTKAHIDFFGGTIYKYSQNTTVIGEKKYLIFEVRGDKNASRLFEFMAKNTNVEWGLMRTGRTKKSLNYMTTSFDSGSESGMRDLYKRKLHFGTQIREFTHNHPNGAPIPSTKDEYGGRGDMAFVEQLHYEQGGNVKFNIYTNEFKYSPFDINYRDEGFEVVIGVDGSIKRLPNFYNHETGN